MSRITYLTKKPANAGFFVYLLFFFDAFLASITFFAARRFFVLCERRETGRILNVVPLFAIKF